jgi:surface protein
MRQKPKPFRRFLNLRGWVKRYATFLLLAVLASLMTIPLAAKAQDGRYIVIHATDREEYMHMWDNQFYIATETPFYNDDTWELRMTIKADKDVTYFYNDSYENEGYHYGINTQLDEQPGNYAHWNAFGEIPFTTEWTEYTASGVFSGIPGDKNCQSIAFNLSLFAEANNYYFDNISLKINGKEQIVNGNIEGYDFSSFWYHTHGETDGIAQVTEDNIQEDAYITAIDLSNVSSDAYYGEYLTGEITAFFSNGKTRQISIYDASIDNFYRWSAGTQTVTISYNGISATKDITVHSVTGIDLSTLPKEISKGSDLTGYFNAIYDNGAKREIPINRASINNFDRNRVGSQRIIVYYNNSSATADITVFNGNANAGSKNDGYLVIKASDKQQEFWDNQFWIVSDKQFYPGDTWEVSMKIKADSPVEGYFDTNGDGEQEWVSGIGTQIHGEPGEYVHWDAWGFIPFTTEWTEYTASGTMSDYLSDVEDRNPHSIAFNLNEFPPANTYYFDDIVFKVNGENVIKNGDFESDDYSSFYYKNYYENNGEIQPVTENNIIGDIAYKSEAISLDLSNVSKEIVTNDNLSGTFTVNYKDGASKTLDIQKAATTLINTLDGEQEFLIRYAGITDTLKVNILGAKSIDISKLNTVIKSPDQTINGDIVVTYPNGAKRTVSVSDATITWGNQIKDGKRDFTVVYDDVYAKATATYDFVSNANGNHVLVVKASEMETYPWDNQFWIVSDKQFNEGDTWEISMKIKADKTVEGYFDVNVDGELELISGIGTQIHGEPGEYVHWEGWGEIPFTTEWVEHTATGTFSYPADANYRDRNPHSIAFNLNDFPPANNYYFDDIVFKINGENVIKNGNFEGNDFSSFYCKNLHEDGAPRVVTEKDFVNDDGTPFFSHQPYLILADNTLTFYYGVNPPDGKVDGLYTINQISDGSDWKTSVKKAVFDASFKDYRPTSTYYWFGWCYNLTEIEGMKENLNTENVINMTYMFYNCQRLTILDLSEFNTSVTQYMYSMFNNCNNLKTIYVGDNWTTDNAYKWGNDMFSDCYKLYGCKGSSFAEYGGSENYARIDGGVDAPGFLTKIGDEPFVAPEAYAVLKDSILTFFYDKNKPTGAFDVPNGINNWYNWKQSVKKVVFDKSFKDYQPTSTSYWFSDCTNLTEIEGMAGNLNTENVTNMNYMFYNCYQLTPLDLSGFNTKNVRSMYQMFTNCQKLKTIYVGDNWTTDNLTDSYYMFSSCYNLYGGKGTQCDGSWYYDNEYNKSLARIDGGMDAPGYLTKIGDKPFVPTIPYAVLNDSTLTLYYGKLTDENAFAFNNSLPYEVRTSVKKVVFDKSLKDYKPTSTYNWFGSFQNLTEIEGMAENLNTENITNMSGMFYYCNKLTTLDLTSFNTKNVADMSYMFCGSNHLTTIYVGDGWTTDNVTESSNMFNNCAYLIGGQGTSLNDTVIDIHYARIDEGTKNPGYFSKLGDKKSEVVSIEITRLPAKLEYNLGELNLQLDSSLVTAKFDNETEFSKRIAAVATVTGYDPYTSGKQTINVEYLGKTTSFDIDVIAKDAPYTIFNNADSTMTFYYGKYREGSTLGIYAIDSLRPRTKTAIIDPSFKAYKPENTNNMFYNYGIMTEIIGMENLNTEKDTSMIYMFAYCNQLTDIDLSNFNTENVKDMSYMFYNDQQLKTLDLSSFNTYKVTNMGDMFTYNYQLATIYVGDNWNTYAVMNERSMFYGCNNLIGGKGTRYGASDGVLYAHIDGGSIYPGYFSKKRDVEDVEIAELPSNVEVLEGTEIDVRGGKINITYSNGTSRTINLSCAKIAGFDPNKVGSQTVAMEYEGKTFTFDVVVKAKTATSIALTTMPSKVEYEQGEEFAAAGGVITISYDNGTQSTVSLDNADIKITGYDKNKVGDQVITAEYLGFNVVFNVTTSEPTPVSEISINGNVRIWSYEKTIYVENGGKQIQVIDITGRLVKTINATDDRIEIPMQKAGIYIVKTVAKTQKVMIR